MAEQDRIKWNRKYQEHPTLLETRPPSPLLEKFFSYAPGHQAIDLACGSGRHTLFLAQNGFHVDAVDISSVALKRLKQRTKDFNVTLYEVDLENFTPQKDKYDLAIMTNYLDRELIDRTTKILKPNALFILETYMEHPENEKKDSNPDFLLQEKELLKLFSNDFTILAYEEHWNEAHELYKMRKQSIVAQKN